MRQSGLDAVFVKAVSGRVMETQFVKCHPHVNTLFWSLRRRTADVRVFFRQRGGCATLLLLQAIWGEQYFQSREVQHARQGFLWIVRRSASSWMLGHKLSCVCLQMRSCWLLTLCRVLNMQLLLRSWPILLPSLLLVKTFEISGPRLCSWRLRACPCIQRVCSRVRVKISYKGNSFWIFISLVGNKAQVKCWAVSAPAESCKTCGILQAKAITEKWSWTGFTAQWNWKTRGMRHQEFQIHVPKRTLNKCLKFWLYEGIVPALDI